MRKTVISDTSCLIVLSNTGELELLKKVYGEILTTPEIAAEFGEQLPSWCRIQAAKNSHYQSILEITIDKGEASAIALAIELAEVTLILDDSKARNVARSLGLSVTGTLGVIVKAKKEKIIPSIKPVIAKLKATNFRFSHELEQIALQEAGEE